MNKLPKVYPVPMDKNIKNNNDIFYGKYNSSRNSLEKNNNLSISSKINRIFNAPDFVYKKDVTIFTNNGSSKKTIIGKTRNYLLTDNNESINISDIIDII